MFRGWQRFRGVDPPFELLELPSFYQPRQVVAWDAEPFQIPGTDDLLSLDKLDQLFCLRLRHVASVTKPR